MENLREYEENEELLKDMIDLGAAPRLHSYYVVAEMIDGGVPDLRTISIVGYNWEIIANKVVEGLGIRDTEPIQKAIREKSIGRLLYTIDAALQNDTNSSLTWYIWELEAKSSKKGKDKIIFTDLYSVAESYETGNSLFVNFAQETKQEKYGNYDYDNA